MRRSQNAPKKAGRREIKLFPESDAEREIKATERFGAAVLFPGELDYPPLLAQLSPPPSILIVKGRLDLIASPSVAIVGARNASAAGLRMAKDLAVELGQRGQVIVSGLARGVDAMAHQAALNTGTIAVIAGGIDNRYPPQNASLQDEIYEHGLVVSENPFGYAPKARDFPKRNRLITGLANGTVVIEAA